ncbi:MAG: toll/interleukin-1 receptor domain-containing protein [Thermoplasmatales archaeon]|jgi:hypothetical protein|nr:toll/interleukin-1 receptor domain-containing protein [Thermoplasmatales archaeon]
MFIDPEEDPKQRRKIREKKVLTQLELTITPANYMFESLKNGMEVPRGLQFREYRGWAGMYIESLSDDDLIALMKRLKLTVVLHPDEWRGVFIIHSTSDSRYANRIKRALNCINIPDTLIYCSSIEKTGTTLGESFCEMIRTCLTNASLIICILSDRSVKSEYCLQEMGAAFVLGHPIIPVIVDGFDPSNMPGFLDNTRYQASGISSFESAQLFLKEVCCKFDVQCAGVNLLNGANNLINDRG